MELAAPKHKKVPKDVYWLSGERLLPFGLLVYYLVTRTRFVYLLCQFMAIAYFLLLLLKKNWRQMGRIKSTTIFCIYENKQADQFRGFPYIDSTVPQLSTSDISIYQPYTMAVHPGLCQT